MSTKKFAVVAMALIAVVVIAVLTGLFQQQDVLSMEYPAVEIPASEVRAIRIETVEHEIVVRNEDGIWRMIEPIDSPIEDPPIQVLLRRFEDLDIEAVATAEPSRYADFGVTPELGRVVTIYWSGGETELIVAGEDEDFQQDFVRVGGDPRVFMLSRKLPVTDNPSSWRDKRIYQGDPSEITGFAVEGPDRNYAIARQRDGSFSIDREGRVDSTFAARTLRFYSMLRADGFEDGSAQVVMEDPELTVTIRRSDGETTLYFRRVGANYAVVRDDVATAFMVTAPRIASIVPPLEALLAE